VRSVNWSRFVPPVLAKNQSRLVGIRFFMVKLTSRAGLALPPKIEATDQRIEVAGSDYGYAGLWQGEPCPT
jgi:hypothetical protein